MTLQQAINIVAEFSLFGPPFIVAFVWLWIKRSNDRKKLNEKKVVE